ncbi:uncharacterized protein [Henckelia pumila]|uniref:uncharacterized protein n=1 Tax=Henckelia pumila TaxID=405737 RepID=UPI003C6E74F9
MEHIDQYVEHSKRRKSRLNGKQKMMEWIIDTGASHHMTGSLDTLRNVKEVLPCSDRTSRMLTGTGELREGLYYLWVVASSMALRTTMKDELDLWHRRQFGNFLKIVYSDNGTEFTCLHDYFVTNGMLHQTSCAGTLQQNGRVERKHCHILNVARALRFQSNLPIEFWGECVLTAAYLINRTPYPLLQGKTPYEILFEQTPSYKNIRVFGFLAYAHNQKHGGDKFASRSRKCIFIGYPFGKQGWCLYDLESGKSFVSRDVIFVEHEIPYMKKSGENNNILDATVFDEFVSEEDEVAADGNENLTQDLGLPLVRGGKHEELGLQASEVFLGRGHRERQQSSRLRDYVLHTGQRLSPFVSPLVTSPIQMHSSAITAGVEPTSFVEAVKDVNWRLAMNKEMMALEDNNTWTVVPLPQGKRAIS